MLEMWILTQQVVMGEHGLRVSTSSRFTSDGEVGMAGPCTTYGVERG